MHTIRCGACFDLQSRCVAELVAESLANIVKRSASAAM
jgi:hypothetical protein